MKKPCGDKPCNDCPFRKTALPGWLGDDTPEGFMATTMADHPMPCHQTVNYDRPGWKTEIADGRQPKARLCAGALIFFSNIAKLSRDPSRPRLPADRETVFTSPQSFIDHHSALPGHKDTLKGRLAYFVQPTEFVEGEGFRVCLALEGEPGYYPTGTWPYSGHIGQTRPLFAGQTDCEGVFSLDMAKKQVHQMNAQMGLSAKDASLIVLSTFGK